MKIKITVEEYLDILHEIVKFYLTMNKDDDINYIVFQSLKKKDDKYRYKIYLDEENNVKIAKYTSDDKEVQ